MKKYILSLLIMLSFTSAQAEGNDSPHDFQFRPSQMELVNNAEVIFYIDDNIETFLKRPLAALPDDVIKVKMSEGLSLLDVKHADLESDSTHDHTHDLKDYHFWLSPKMAMNMVSKIEEVLTNKYPENAAKYKENAAATIIKLQALDKEITAKLKASEIKPFLLFHSAFQYFENDYDLKARGFISLDPTQPPSIGHVKEIRQIIKQDNIACIFTEPQFNRKSVDALANGTNIKLAELDETGALLTPGKELYFELLRNNAASYASCR